MSNYEQKQLADRERLVERMRGVALQWALKQTSDMTVQQLADLQYVMSTQVIDAHINGYTNGFEHGRSLQKPFEQMLDDMRRVPLQHVYQNNLGVLELSDTDVKNLLQAALEDRKA